MSLPLQLISAKRAFDPRSLYAGGVDGVLLLPDVTSSVWQDAAATTPAGNGDPIGRLSDLSGNGNHATQSTATRRPIYTIGSGLYSSEGDATDDVLATGSLPSATSAFLLVLALRIDSTPSSRYVWYHRTAVQAGFFAQTISLARMTMTCYPAAGSVTITTPTNSIVLGQPFILTLWYDGTAAHLQVDSQAVVDSSSFALASASAPIYVGAALASGAQPIDGGIYGAIYIRDAVVSPPDREACKAYLATRAGVTL